MPITLTAIKHLKVTTKLWFTNNYSGVRNTPKKVIQHQVLQQQLVVYTEISYCYLPKLDLYVLQQMFNN